MGKRRRIDHFVSVHFWLHNFYSLICTGDSTGGGVGGGGGFLTECFSPRVNEL